MNIRETFEEKKMRYLEKIIQGVRAGLNTNQIALQIESSEGANFKRGILISALNEIRESATNKPQKNVVGMDKCPACKRDVSINVTRCPNCNAVVRCSCGEKVKTVAQYSCARCLKVL